MPSNGHSDSCHCSEIEILDRTASSVQPLILFALKDALRGQMFRNDDKALCSWIKAQPKLFFFFIWQDKKKKLVQQCEKWIETKAGYVEKWTSN